MKIDTVILARCEKELKEFPKVVIEDLLDAVAKLSNGLNLSMPLSRSLSSIQKGLHEIRLRAALVFIASFILLKKVMQFTLCMHIKRKQKRFLKDS